MKEIGGVKKCLAVNGIQYGRIGKILSVLWISGNAGIKFTTSICFISPYHGSVTADGYQKTMKGLSIGMMALPGIGLLISLIFMSIMGLFIYVLYGNNIHILLSEGA